MADALGMIEARSFAAMVEAADAMVKAAKVELVSYEETGGGYVTAIVRGDVAAVKAAVQAGIQNAEKVGEIIATHVIARPHANIDLVNRVCSLLDEARPRKRGKYAELIRFVKDRPGHDRRYAIDSSKIARELGWRPRESFDSGLAKTVRWYAERAA